MHTIQGVGYSTNGKLEQGSMFHRGPGSARFLTKVVAQSLVKGLRVYIRCNTTYTDLVEEEIKQVVPNEWATRPAAEDLSSDFDFGGYSFAQTVGLWLKESQNKGSSCLNPFISIDSFEFTPDEFLELRERLEQTIRKNNRLTTVSEALADLNTGFFRHQTLEESESFIREHLEAFLQRARQLKSRFVVEINGHARRSVFQQRSQLQERSNALDEIAVLTQELLRLSGRQARKQQQQRIKDLWAAYHQAWYGTDDGNGVPDEATILQEREQLLAATENLTRELAAANLSLSHLTVDPALGEATTFLSLANDLERLVQDVDESGLYQLPLGGASAATAARQLQRLETVLQRLNNSYLHLPELPAFYANRHFWYAQPAKLRRLLAPLQGVPTSEWGTAFASWYFDRCLEQFPAEKNREYRAEELASWLRTVENEAISAPSGNRPVFLRPGEAVPQEADVLIDFTGRDAPEGFKGTFRGLRPLTDTNAQHHSLAGVMDPRLVLQQAFIPLSPPAWKLVQVNQPPPGTEGVSFQLNDQANWQPFSAWDGQPSAQLHLYLPEAFSAEDGKLFLKHFEEVLRQAEALTLFYDWSPAAITQALLSDGLNPSFLMAALLRAAEASSEEPYDQAALVAVGKEIRFRYGIPDPDPHPLAERMRELLQERLPNYFFRLHQPWRDTFLPLVVLSPSGRKTVLLPGGRLPGRADKYAEALRQQALLTAGLNCLEIRAYACWEAVDTEVDRLVKVLTAEE